jgi:hypothetical protein
MNREDLVSVIEIRDKQGRVVGKREVVRYAALLNRAHDEGLKKIRTQLSQLPNKENGMVAVATAFVETGKGSFCGIADASPENTNSRVGRFLIALAETRAKARALRDAVNIGVVSLEELLGEDLENGIVEARSAATERGQVKPFPAKTVAPSGTPDGNGAPMTEAQRRYLFRLLAGRDIRGEAAHEYLREKSGKESLKTISKEEASSLIEDLSRKVPV